MEGSWFFDKNKVLTRFQVRFPQKQLTPDAQGESKRKSNIKVKIGSKVLSYQLKNRPSTLYISNACSLNCNSMESKDLYWHCWRFILLIGFSVLTRIVMIVIWEKIVFIFNLSFVLVTFPVQCNLELFTFAEDTRLYLQNRLGRFPDWLILSWNDYLMGWTSTVRHWILRHLKIFVSKLREIFSP